MKYCRECGKEINENAVICIHCGCQVKEVKNVNTRNNKWITLLLWFFLGGIGGHKFYIGRNDLGIAYLLSMTIGWLLFAIPPMVVGILLMVDFIAILSGEMNGVKLEG